MEYVNKSISLHKSEDPKHNFLLDIHYDVSTLSYLVLIRKNYPFSVPLKQMNIFKGLRYGIQPFHSV